MRTETEGDVNRERKNLESAGYNSRWRVCSRECVYVWDVISKLETHAKPTSQSADFF